ncbi:hypothetical protein J6590_032493 [Homalodisca vitripennis]|nr:hypothetical protein J6590_032493 [Homalodisca vitripennis]
MNGSTTLRLDADPIALAGRGHSIFQLFGQTRRTSPADGTHGDPIESQHNHKESEKDNYLPKVGELASHVERDEQRTDSNAVASPNLVGKLVKVNQLTSTKQSNQAENQYSDGVTPPPTDKSGRGCNPKQNLSPTERKTNKLWHRIREVENPNRKRSPEQKADQTRSS